jgi:4-diphosphocytidyl-2-C-methyl-D-erythritol kinase
MDTTNDLEAPARAIAPAIGDVLGEFQALPDARLARMSGSGATCFALFNTDEAAAHAAETISRRHQDWWCVATRIADISPAALLG